MANIRDIAKHADVSVTTVSRVLNEHPYVSKEKRTRVHAAMKELGYLRNQQALTLSTGKTQRIVVILPYMNHPYYGFFVNGLAKAALDPAEMPGKLRALRTLGAPYTDAELAQAGEDVKGKTELDALVAYLQVLGTAVK